MSRLDVTPEIDTLSNVISNFGWKIIKREITEEDVVLTIKKIISPPGEITPPAAA